MIYLISQSEINWEQCDSFTQNISIPSFWLCVKSY